MNIALYFKVMDYIYVFVPNTLYSNGNKRIKYKEVFIEVDINLA